VVAEDVEEAVEEEAYTAKQVGTGDVRRLTQLRWMEIRVLRMILHSPAHGPVLNITPLGPMHSPSSRG